MLVKIAWKSLLNRKFSVLLTIVSVTLSVFILVGMDHIRLQAKESFSRTVSGVDLIVGARTGELNLLLASVFRIGHFTNSVSWKSYEQLTQSPSVAWSVPITLGDSHKGFPVIGTTLDYFQHFAYGNKQHLAFEQGRAFDHDLEVVLGSSVAKKLNLFIGDKLTLSHGTGNVSFTEHKDKPFAVVGILQSTGTPVDEGLHVSLFSIERIHGSSDHHYDDDHELEPINNDDLGQALEHEHEHEHEKEYVDSDDESNNQQGTFDPSDALPSVRQPEKISAFLIGLKSKLSILQVQYAVNQNQDEALSAIVPGVALAQLWELIGIVENLLRLTSLLILIAALFGLSTMLLASIEERSRELAIMRAIGAGPLTIASLVQIEALGISIVSSGIALALLGGGLSVAQGWLSQEFGLFISNQIINVETLKLVGWVVMSTILVSFLPTAMLYKKSLQSGLSVK